MVPSKEGDLGRMTPKTAPKLPAISPETAVVRSLLTLTEQLVAILKELNYDMSTLNLAAIQRTREMLRQ